MTDHPDDVRERPLAGCTVAVTRERRGRLGQMLETAGATVVHVPLIEVVDPPSEDVARLREAVEAGVDWVVVTSPAGAERAGPLVIDRAEVRLAAVGTATAQRLRDIAGREIDLVPDRQLGVELARAFNATQPAGQRVLVAQADRADTGLAQALTTGNHRVQTVTAYQTRLRHPSADEIDVLHSADMVLFASGSAATGWADSLGASASETLPDIVVVIGPSTAAAAWKSGLKVTDIAADHSLAGLVDAVTLAWSKRKS